MKKINITELVLRDGHQCMIATRLRTDDMLPICSKLDSIGFWSLEAWGGATFDACVRFLKEDPWERVRLVSKIITRTPLRLIAGRVNTFEYNPPSMYRLFVERAG